MKRKLKIEPIIAENRDENLKNKTCANSSSDESVCFSIQPLESCQNELEAREKILQHNISNCEQIEGRNCESFMDMLKDTGNQLVTHLHAL